MFDTIQFHHWVFDFDDTLFFTNELNASNYCSAVKKVLNIKLPTELILNNILEGKIFPNLLHEFIPVNDQQIYEEIRALKRELMIEQIDQISKNTKIFDFISRSDKSRSFYIWTNSDSEWVTRLLDKHKYAHHFIAIISRDKMIKPKPSLEGLRLIRRKFKVKKRDLIIVDDSNLNLKILKKNGYYSESPSNFDY